MNAKSLVDGSRSTYVAEERCSLKTGERADPVRLLSPSELQVLWRRVSVDAERGRPHFKVLRLALRLAAQSLGGLIRAQSSDVDWNAGTLRFVRRIGSLRGPRHFLLPLSGSAKAEVETLIDQGQALRVSVRTVLTALRDLRVELVSESEWSRPYSFLDLQRTALESISVLGVTRKVCGLLRGRPVRAVTTKRFWDCEYLREKSEALQKWEAYLDYLVFEPTIRGSLIDLVLAEPNFFLRRTRRSEL